YVAERGTILRYGSTDHDTFGQVETISLPSQIDAICYDDANDRLLALSVSDRRLMLLTRELQLVRNDPLPPAVALAGHASIAINPADQSEWIATSGVRELTRLVRDPGSLRIIVDERLAIAEIDEPHAVHFTVDGGLAIADVDEVHLFVPDFVSGWK